MNVQNENIIFTKIIGIKNIYSQLFKQTQVNYKKPYSNILDYWLDKLYICIDTDPIETFFKNYKIQQQGNFLTINETMTIDLDKEEVLCKEKTV